MTCRIAWDDETPDEIKRALHPIIVKLLPFVPGWVHELRLGYDHDNTDAIAYNKTKVEYRWARIMVCGCWIAEPPSDRAGVILHEVLHIATEGVDAAFQGFAQESPSAQEVRRAAHKRCDPRRHRRVIGQCSDVAATANNR